MMVAAVALALTLAAGVPQLPDTTLVISSDTVLGARVAKLLPELARLAQMELVRPIRVERRSRGELEGYLRFKLDQEMPPEEASYLTRSYALLGLLDGEVDLRDLLLSVYTEQVAGFYDPDSTALFVMDDMPADMLETVLVHELVHAVQDQTADLDSLTAKTRGNDRQAAAQAAIEGHATLVMLDYMSEQLQGEPLDFSSLPDFSQAIRPALEGMRAQYPALAGAPAIIRESLFFPYLEGASFVAALWQQKQGRPPPFGDLLPQSSEQIMDPGKDFGPEPDPPSEVRMALDPELEVLYENTLGQMELGIVLDTHLGSEGDSLAEGWDGDRYLLLRNPSGEDGLLWASVWDSMEARDRFATGFGPALAGLAAPATLDRIDVGGRPGLLLRLSVPEDVEVVVREVASG
jgi:hypothetical protein